MQQQANPDGETHGKVHWSAHVTGLPAAQLIRFTYFDTNGSWHGPVEGTVTKIEASESGEINFSDFYTDKFALKSEPVDPSLILIYGSHSRGSIRLLSWCEIKYETSDEDGEIGIGENQSQAESKESHDAKEQAESDESHSEGSASDAKDA